MQKRTQVDNANGDFLRFHTKPKNAGSFNFSCFNKGKAFKDIEDHELFLDMDASLPHYEESQSNLCSNTLSQEFEFLMPFSSFKSTDSREISPADELFYKGHLLPLHLSSRLQMKAHMSSPTSGQSQLDRDPSSVTLSYYLKADDLKLCSSSGAKDNITDDQERWNSVCLVPQSNDGAIFSVDNVEDKPPVKYRQRLQKIFFNSSNAIKQDPCEFPNCYKDPALLCQSQQMLESQVTKQKRLRSSGPLRWKLLPPSLNKNITIRKYQRSEESVFIRRFTDSKDQKRMPSFLNVRKVFLKSLPSRDLVRAFPKQLDNNHRWVHGTLHHPVANNQSAGFWELKTPTNSHESDNDRILSRARDCLQKYWKIWKPTRTKLVADKTQAVKYFQLPSIQVRPKLRGTGERQTSSQNLRAATSFTKRSGGAQSAPSSRTPTDHGRIREDHKARYCWSSATILEMQSAIQGAIQHCKQSQGSTACGT